MIGWLSIGVAAYELSAFITGRPTVSLLSRRGHPAVRLLIWGWLAALAIHLWRYE